ncbi:MAG: hypothetical protein LBS21_15410 [Clostridiales bacterium]|jgi:soluble cytochrome b562|nr:hypothetical protein [Clostridiales bacterium]
MKKAVIMFLFVALTAGLFTGCINSSQNAPQAAPPAQAEASAPAADAVTSASPKESSDPAALIQGLSANGYWIFSVLSDVTVNEAINVDGEFHDKADPSAALYRKLSLYAQDENYTVTASHTLTVPQINVTSPNFRIQEGTVKGDIYVNAEGFELLRCTLDGNLTFATQGQMDSAKLSEGTVTGTVSVK